MAKIGSGFHPAELTRQPPKSSSMFQGGIHLGFGLDDRDRSFRAIGIIVAFDLTLAVLRTSLLSSPEHPVGSTIRSSLDKFHPERMTRLDTGHLNTYTGWIERKQDVLGRFRGIDVLFQKRNPSGIDPTCSLSIPDLLESRSFQVSDICEIRSGTELPACWALGGSPSSSLLRGLLNANFPSATHVKRNPVRCHLSPGFVREGSPKLVSECQKPLG